MIDELLPTDAPVLGDEDAAGVPSLLDQLAGERDDAAVALGESLKLPVPGYKTLWVGYRYVPPSEAAQNPAKYKGMPAKLQAPMMAADTLAALCEMFYVGEAEDDLVPLHVAANLAAPVRFDDVARERICRLPAITNASQTVFDVYANGEYGIIDHAQRLTRWLKNTTLRAEGGLLGG